MRQLLAILITALTIPLLCTLSGCTERGQSSKDLLANELLKKLPDTTVAFSLVDFNGSGYQNLQKSLEKTKLSSKSQNLSASNIIPNLIEDRPLLDVLKNIIKASKDSGLISPDGHSQLQKFFHQGIYFLSNGAPSAQALLHLGFLGKHRTKESALMLLKNLESSFVNSGFQCNQKIEGNSTILSVSMPSFPKRIFFFVDELYVGFATQKAILTQLGQHERPATHDSLVTSEEYLRVTSDISPIPNPLGISFISLKKLVPQLEHVSSSQLKQASLSWNSLPMDSIFIQDSFSDQRLVDIKLAIKTDRHAQLEMLETLSASEFKRSPVLLPSNAAFILTSNVSTSKADPTAKIPSALRNTSPSVSKLLKAVTSISLALRTNESGSPVPDVFLSMSVKEGKQVVTEAKELAGNLMMMAGISPQWFTKKIFDTKVDFFNTLIGAGIYIAQEEGTGALLISSSEMGIRDMLQAVQKETNPFKKKFTNVLSANSNAHNLSSLYIDFNRTASLMDSINGTLAMMTGGNSPLHEALDTSWMRTLGFLGANAGYSKGIISIRISQIPQ